MPRPILDESRIDSAIRDQVARYQPTILNEVMAAVSSKPVVIVGMRQNPFPRKARRALDEAGIGYEYLEYGSYFGMWRQRLALKMWTGWSTFPMVFVKGVLIGGFTELQKMIASGELKSRLA